MKQLLFFIAVFLPALCFCQDNTYTLKGELPDKPSHIYLRYNRGNQTYITSDAPVIQGKFVLKGTIDAPYKAYLTIKYTDSADKGYSDNLEFFLDAGTTVIRAIDSLHNAAVSGTQLCMDADEYQKTMDSLYAMLTAAYTAIEKSASGAGETSAEYKNETAAIEDSFMVHQKSVYTAFIRSHPDSRLNLYIFREQSYFFEYPELASLFKGISPKLRTSTAGKEYAARLERLKAVAIGQYAPDFSHPDSSGRMVRLSSFRGKYVLLDFWASWCGPCRGESPYLVTAYDKYKDKKFTIVGVSLDKKAYRRLWLQAIAHDKLYWTQLSDGSDNNPIVKLYGVKGIPQNFLIGPDGKIISHNLRGAALDKTLSQLLQ